MNAKWKDFVSASDEIPFFVFGLFDNFQMAQRTIIIKMFLKDSIDFHSTNRGFKEK